MADPLYGRQVLMPSMTHAPPITQVPPVTQPPPMTNPLPKAQPPAVQQSHDQSLTPPDSPTKQLYEVWAVPPQAVVQQMHDQSQTKRKSRLEASLETSRQCSPSPSCQSKDQHSPLPRCQPRGQRSSSSRPPVWAIPPQAVIEQGGQAPAGQHATQPSAVQESHDQSRTPSPVPTEAEPQFLATEAVRALMTQPPPSMQPPVVQQSHYQSLTPSPVPTQAVPATLAQAGPVQYGGQAPAEQHMTHPPPLSQPSVVQQSHYQSLTPSPVPTQAVPQVPATLTHAGLVLYDGQAPAGQHMTQASVVQQCHYQSLTPSAVPTQAVPQVSATQAVAGPVQFGGTAPAQQLMTHPPPVAQPSVVQQCHYQSLTPSAVPTQAVPQEPATLAQAVAGPVQFGGTAPAQQHMTHPPPVAQPSVVQQCHYQSLTPFAVPTQAVPQEPATLAQAGLGVEFIELNTYNAANFIAEHDDIILGGYPSQWHKITINTPVLESKRKLVILAINEQLTPMKLIPYFFRMENNRITFHVNLCGVALKKLCRRNLKVPYISDEFVEIEMTITLFSKYLNILETMEKIVSRRLDTRGKFLDLSDINSIPEVREMLFDPTDNWHILEQLLRIAQVTVPELATLGLARNGIVETTYFWELLASSKWLSLRALDLSDNEIESICAIKLSRPWAISELYLDRNPICSYLDRSSYISAVRVTFPCLSKLDGTYPHTTEGVPDWKPNFIVASAGDSGEFADQFIEHFFTLYDGADRMKLHGLYHKNAYFSMKFPFYTGSKMNYGSKTRNLLRGFNKKEARAALTRGSKTILKRLSNLPKTEHDPYTFAVDLTVHTPKLTVLTVTGVFRDFSTDKRTHRHFSRTFVLTGRRNGEYQITNDILFISNATDRETQEAFRFERPPKGMKYRPMSNLSDFDKEYMIIQVQHVTNMSAIWSRKCLEDTNWDLKEALEVFMELLKKRKIPKSAFSPL